jgi:hypothetical protein
MEIPIIGGTSFHPLLPSYRHVTLTNIEYLLQLPSSPVDRFPEHSRQERRAQARRRDPTMLTFRDNTLYSSCNLYYAYDICWIYELNYFR